MNGVRVGVLRLWWGLLRAFPGSLVAVAGVLLTTTAVAAVVPQVVDATLTDSAAQRMEGLGPRQASVAAVVPFGSGQAAVEIAPSDVDADLAAIRDAAGEALRPRLTEGRWLASRGAIEVIDESGSALVNPLIALSLGAASEQESVTYVAGRAPVLGTPPDLGEVERVQALGRVFPLFEVAINADAAEKMGLGVGDVLAVGSVGVELVGVYVVDDPDDVLWRTDGSLFAGVLNRDLGIRGPRVDAGLLMAPEVGIRNERTYRWQVSGADMTPEQVVAVAADLDALTAGSVPAATGGLRPASTLASELRSLRERQVVTMGLLASTTAGVLTAGLGVLALTVGLLLQRRRPTVTLLRGRGASAPAVAAGLAMEVTVLLAVPVLVLVTVLALMPGRLTPSALLLVGAPLASLLIVAPLVLWWQASSGAPDRTNKSRQGGRQVILRQGRGASGILASGVSVRLSIELLVALLAASGVGLALGQRDPGGVDLLVSGTGVFVALLLGLVLARSAPALARLAVRATARRQGAVAFLGAAMTARGGGTVATLPVVILVLTLATTVSGAVILQTLQTGSRAAVWAEVGAPARSGTLSAFGATDIETLRQSPAVGAAVGLARDEARLDTAASGGAGVVVDVVAADDAAQWGEVLGQVPGGPWPAVPDPVEFDGGLPVLVGNLDEPLASSGLRLSFDRGPALPVRVLEVADGDLPGLSSGEPWLLVDLSALRSVSGLVHPLQEVRASPPSHVDREGVVDVNGLQELSEAMTSSLATPLLGPPPPVVTVAARLSALDVDPLVGLLRRSVLVGAVATSACLVGSVLLVLLLGAPARTRLLLLLRTLGLGSAGGRRLVMWELLPLAVVSTVGGAIAGVASAIVLAPALGLDQLAAASGPVPLVLDPLLLALMSGGHFALLVGVGALVARGASGAGLGRALRVGEEL